MQKKTAFRESREKSIAEVFQSKDTVLIKDSDDETTDDQQDNRKVRVSEALDSLYALKCFAEIHGDNHMNVMIINRKSGNTQVTKRQTNYDPYVF